jgi:hypothetical protein
MNICSYNVFYFVFGDFVRTLITKIINHPALPISLLVVICLTAGLFTFQDYGMGWDEPLFYKYADAIPYAYSIAERLSGNFNILKSYGPSETDHMMYGPAYILSARPLVLLVTALTGSSSASGWHLVNFVLFIVCVVFVYLFALKWISRWAAFTAALLFATQPLLWGHAFINPKDIPFMAFFTIALYTGYRMVEKTAPPSDESGNNAFDSRRWKAALIFFWGLFIAFLLLSSSVVFFKNQIQEWIPKVIQTAVENPATFPGLLFRLLSNNTAGPDLKAYITKGLSIYNRSLLPLLLLTVMLGMIVLLATFKKDLVSRGYQAIRLNWSWKSTIIAGIALGFLTAIRILGPFAGLLVSLFFIFKFGKRAIFGIFIYAVIAFATMYMLWPYLWRSPISGLLAVLKHMADNPQNVPVLFNGQVISSRALPANYFWTMLGLTLTEPVWLLFIAGAIVSIYLMRKSKLDWKEFVPFSLWFLIPFTYVLVSTPPQYDGFRHFTFLLPPVFVIGGIAISLFFEKNRHQWINPLLVILLVLPGIAGIISHHPYQYTYYNSFAGGTKGAFRRFETDYWLTCYKEVFDKLNQNKEKKKIFVHKNKYLASQYAGGTLTLEQFEPDLDTTRPGDLLLLSSRTNNDQQYHVDDPSLLEINLDGAVFCTVKIVQ